MADVNLTHTGAELDAAIAAVIADYADVSGVTAGAADVITGKIFVDAAGAEVTGTNDGSGDTSDATANAGNILATKTAYVAAGKVTGVMPNNAGDVAAASYHADGTSLHIVPEAGYMDGSDDAVVITDAGFVAANIADGVTIFGKAGSMAGGAANSIVITAVDANKRITEIDLSSFSEIYPYLCWDYSGAQGAYINLVAAILSDSLTAIGAYAFYRCDKLALTSLPSGVTSIGTYAFYTNAEITFTSLPSGVTSIAEYTFYACSKLALTSLPSGVTSIGVLSFYLCAFITLTSLPSGVTSIGNNAFNGCSRLALTSLPTGITSIADSTFKNCSLLAITALPDGLTSIGHYAFTSCAALTTLWISNNCTTISANTAAAAPFYGCSSGLVLYCEAASKPAGWGTYYNYYSAAGQLTVNWDVSWEEYEAL